LLKHVMQRLLWENIAPDLTVQESKNSIERITTFRIDAPNGT